MSSHVETRDSLSAVKQVQIDSVEKLVEVKVTDTFDNKITIKEPCDSTGKLKNGFRQVFTNGSFSAEVVIENNEIKVHFKGAKTESRKETNRARSIQSDSTDKKVDHVVKTDKKVETEKGSGFWDRIKAVVGWIGTVVLSIVVWELLLKNVFKTFINLIK